MIRDIFVFLHRWVGLLTTIFLVIVGLTGSLLAFNNELEHVFAPELYARPHPGEAPLDLATLAERAETLVPHAHVRAVALTEPDQAHIAFRPETNPTTGKSYELGFNQFYVDPWTGAELGHRNKADLSEGLINVMPFIYRLHDQLMLKATGATILGVVAVFWTIDCFVGFYLTLPVSLSGFWRRWKPAWLIKRKAGFYRLNFDLHRASGLWLWPVLFIFAWSSVMFDMRSVYEWVTPKLFDYRYVAADTKELAERPPKPRPLLDWRAALVTGERLMGEQAAIYGLTSVEPRALSYNDRAGVYTYSARSSLNIAPTGGLPYVMFDGDNGSLLKVRAPNGQHAGNTISSWLIALHMATVFGLPYRIFVCVLGLVITTLSATGVYIWWKKRSARLYRKIRLASAGAPFEPKAAE
ncbi:hypothetical+protein [Methylocapsa aurea]|uniref:PepSY-associated TM helix domain-containing protein n=1 Tax=Methylocapsa aurea TaxID=663610 RepID=UPI003D18E651